MHNEHRELAAAGVPRQDQLSGRVLSSKLSSVVLKGTSSTEQPPSMPAPSAVSNLLALCFFPASTRPHVVPFLHIYKQAGRHGLKQKICTKVEESFGSVYYDVPSELFVLKGQLNAKLSQTRFRHPCLPR